VQFVGPLSVVDAALADHAEAVVRDTVSNAVQHADANTLTVTVNVGHELLIEVADNGVGISGDITCSGLTNLRKRAEDVGGSFTIGNIPSGGTVLRWSAPLP
jgi:signal transduction histidine kinase